MSDTCSQCNSALGRARCDCPDCKDKCCTPYHLALHLVTQHHPPPLATPAQRLDILADLVGVAEVAAGLKVPLFRVRRWIDRRKSTQCPEPLRCLHGLHIYSMQEWRGWFAIWRVTRGQGVDPIDPKTGEPPQRWHPDR